MRFAEFVRATGATPKQIHYWSHIMQFTTTDPEETPPRWRDYDPEVVGAVRLLVKVSNEFGGYFSVDTLARIFYAYPYRGIDFEGFRMEW